MIRNIVFDLGNVIFRFDRKKLISRFTADPGEAAFLDDEVISSDEWGLMDLGHLTLDEAIDSINGRTRNIHSRLVERFLSEWFMVMDVNEETVDIALKLREKGFRLFALSNISREPFRYFSSHRFFAACDGAVISAYEGLTKPDERVFRILLDRYGLEAAECLFIDDDDTGRSYGTAGRLGILGRPVRKNDPEDVKDLLREYGIIY